MASKWYYINRARKIRRQMYGADDRFCNYVEIVARWFSIAACGHGIKPGDVIGWHRGLRKGRCAACWSRWKAENADERHNENMAEAARESGNM